MLASAIVFATAIVLAPASRPATTLMPMAFTVTAMPAVTGSSAFPAQADATMAPGHHQPGASGTGTIIYTMTRPVTRSMTRIVTRPVMRTML
jgi:hypothetical protein